MSTQAIAATTASPTAIAPGMLAASARVQRLQAMAVELRGGPTSFAAALSAASGASAGQATAQPIATTAQAGYGQAGATAGALAQGGYATSPAIGAGATGTSGASPAGGGQYDQLIQAAAARNGVDPAVLHGLIQQESDFDPNSQSSAGAVGLTQLMPSTAASLGVSDPLDPAQSIEGGARYLSQMLQKFGGNVDDALAAYNAGPGAVQQYGGVPPYAETQQYVSKVLGYAAEYQQGATGASAPASAPATTGAIA